LLVEEGEGMSVPTIVEVEEDVLVLVPVGKGIMLVEVLVCGSDVSVTVEVEVSPGSVLVVVIVPPGRVLTPPGPAHTLPRGQQPYLPLVPSQQIDEAGQPPWASGQQV